jgi:CheY-like chemotaxis protein
VALGSGADARQVRMREEERPSGRNRVEASGPLVLIVDDDLDSRETARMVLEEEGYAVDVAPHGAAALDRLKRVPTPTVMLVDLMMPVMDGMTLLRNLESSAEHSAIPVIVMTASGPDAQTSGLRYPVLRKPFDLDELMRLVSERSPRLWDEEDGTDKTSVPEGSGAHGCTGDSTPRVLCVGCDQIASTRCVGCGEAFCRRCIDAGPDGRCPTCWKEAHR